MITVSVLYPNESGTKFDETYYLQKHMPLVRERWSGLGLKDSRVMRGTPGPEGAAPYRVITLLSFGSVAEFQKAAEAHGPELFGDIPNFTDCKPVVQVNEVIG
ncbi:EthD family reductase [Roseicella frigidaeris]|uniref:EthD family reductase n=1 Tax=Roseicella frigidaeris TaxID=2230885 RepID=A0A327M7D0_9PROT|nr:EthD family reductase [Roseicella frigidaeris]RAI58256.1 EthD family reductase [Roseicella frigidaeris]